MKQIQLSILVWLALVSATMAVSAESLVANGSFEHGRQTDLLAGLDVGTREFYGGTSQSPLEGWAFGGKWEKGDYTIAVSGEAHGGLHSCRIDCRTRGRGGIASSPVKLMAGDGIRVSFWMKAQAANGGRIFLNFEGSPGDGWASKELKTGTFGWTQFLQQVVVPTPKAGSAQTVVVFLYTTCEGSVWIDDFRLDTVDANAPVESPASAKRPLLLPEPQLSNGYRINVVSPLAKVFQSDGFAPFVKADKIAISAARNEYESAQLVVEAPWRDVAIKEVRFSALRGPGGASISASALKWERVGYVETTVVPPYYTERGLGRYPDPLMPAGEFTVSQRSRTPIWITVNTPRECAAGVYKGTVTVVPDGRRPTTISLELKVWDFALSDQTHLKTMTWLGEGGLREFYGYPWNPEGDRKQAVTVAAYQDMLLEHRLGPGGEVVAQVEKGKDGYDFNGIDATLERLIGKGMNSFLMGTAPNLKREQKTEYSPEFVTAFTERIRAYADHLRAKGWADKAYVYVYDEAPESAWPEVKKIDRAIKAAAPEVRILQCLNEPEGVKALTGFADVFDVYVPHYTKAGVADAQKRGAEVWLATCCYPMENPNFFLEYPLLDVRATFWVCWKHQVNGFEYWSATSWGRNGQQKGAKWPQTPWISNAFGKYNGDGYLLYPGDNGRPYSSIRLEAFRDGLEDYEYLWTLRDLVHRAEAAKKIGPSVDIARRLLTVDGLVKESGTYETDPIRYGAYRTRLAEAIVGLKAFVK